MISQNIRTLRIQKGLTQKQLADLLHVTSQAVSRWENGDVEPSIDTISSMAKIFEVTTDEIINGPESRPQTQNEAPAPQEPIILKEPVVVKEQVVVKEPVIVEKERVVVQEGRPVLAVCESCNKPIYDGNEIVRYNTYHRSALSRSHDTVAHVRCKACDERIKANIAKQQREHGLLQRKRSFIWSTVFAILALAVGIIVIVTQGASGGTIALTVALPILTFTFASCMFLQNNFIGDLFETVSLWGFVKFPGLIFELSLGGIAWLIVVKILFWILGMILAIMAFLLALVLCMVLSVFTYPYAIVKNIKHPELYEE